MPYASFRRSRTGRWLSRLAGCLLVILCTIPAARATHIVGGQLGMKYVARGVYDVSFTLYFDVINGDPGAFDTATTVMVYERRLGRAGTMDTLTLPFLTRQRVTYTNPGCQTSSLITDEIQYGRRVFLDPTRYTSPNGYYLVWQRAARNNVITNLAYVQYGTNPPLPNNAVSQTFYMEFPALVTTGGADFVNSSPTGFRPLRDYGCVGRPFRYPFGGTDPDGDSLVYDLVTPLQYVCDSIQLFSGNCIAPLASPAPYPPITWAAGYDSTNQIPGPAPLQINRATGDLTFTAGQQGLFVFAVRVREYRRGRLLGELRREFQELINNCPLNQAPTLSLTAPAPPRSGPVLTNNQLIVLPGAGDPGERCLNVYSTDPDTTTRLHLRIVPLDSFPSLPTFSITNGVVNTTSRRDTLYSRLCFDDCFSTNNRPLRFLVISEDEGCPAPQPDTVQLLVQAAGRLPAPVALSVTPAQFAYAATAGQAVSFSLAGSTSGTEPVTVTVADINGQPPSAFPSLTAPTVVAQALASTQVQWVIDCSLPPGSYRMRLRAFTPGAACVAGNQVDTVVTVTVTAPPDAPTSIAFDGGTNQFAVRAGQALNFGLTGRDGDLDPVTLQAMGLTTAPLTNAAFNATLLTDRTTGTFRWEVPCTLAPGTYRIGFSAAVATSAGCRPASQVDTAAYVAVAPPEAQFDEQPANVITPNGDNLNDRFAPRLSRSGSPTDCAAATWRLLRVYNRWGREVYRTASDAGWDGGSEAAGTYYYLLEYADRPSLKGWLQVIR